MLPYSLVQKALCSTLKRAQPKRNCCVNVVLLVNANGKTRKTRKSTNSLTKNGNALPPKLILVTPMAEILVVMMVQVKLISVRRNAIKKFTITSVVFEVILFEPLKKCSYKFSFNLEKIISYCYLRPFSECEQLKARTSALINKRLVLLDTMNSVLFMDHPQ